MKSQKGSKKATKINTSCAGNLGIKLDLSNAITLDFVAFFTYQPNDMICFAGESMQFNPLLLRYVGQRKRKDSMDV
jgi:hypothetical protein